MAAATAIFASLLLTICQFPQSAMGFLSSKVSLRCTRKFAMSVESDKIAKSWATHFAEKRETKYQIIAGPELEEFAQSLVALYPERFMFHQTKWDKFPDGTDCIEMGGFNPVNRISGQDVLMLASFHNNDVTLSQFSVMITLLNSFISSLTVVLPYYPVGTMERVSVEGQVATANTYAQLFSNLPSCGKPTRLMTYDLHTLQNRFYLHGNAIASLQTSIPMLIEELKKTKVDCIAFPDDGAAKRYGSMFKGLGFEIVTCGKIRDGEKRVVNIQDGNAAGKTVVIVDDLVQTGGILYEWLLSPNVFLYLTLCKIIQIISIIYYLI